MFISLRGLSHHLAGDRAHAMRRLRAGHPARSEDGRRAIFYRGHVYLSEDDNDRAIADLTEAIRLEPTERRSYADRAEAYRRKSEHDLAIADLTELVRLDPRSYVVFEARASSYREKGELDLAVSDLTEAIRLRPRLIEPVSQSWYCLSSHKATASTPSPTSAK